MVGARRSVKSVTMLERASICRFVLAGIANKRSKRSKETSPDL